MIRFIFQVFRDIGKKFSKEILRITPRTPMMRQREIELISEAILNLKPKNILEWGSGQSTLYYPKLLSENAIWLSI